jgi:hypothetical protein
MGAEAVAKETSTYPHASWNAPSEDFADHSLYVITSLLNYPQGVESLISGPACDAPLWLLGVVSVRIALRGFLDLALVSNRRFPQRWFLFFTPTNGGRGI